jgi:hypothetical protein
VEACKKAYGQPEQHELSTADWKMITSSYIYHVRIVSRSSRIDTSLRRITERYCSEAQVLRRFKGEVVPDTRDCDPDAEKIIMIKWQLDLAGRGMAIADRDLHNSIRKNYLSPGSEYVVILDLWPSTLHTGERAYRLVMYSGGFGDGAIPTIYPVRDGMLIDEENAFSLGCEVPLDVFQSYVRSFRIFYEGHRSGI